MPDVSGHRAGVTEPRTGIEVEEHRPLAHLNHASREELMKLPLTPEQVDRLLGARPLDSWQQVALAASLEEDAVDKLQLAAGRAVEDIQRRAAAPAG